MNQLKGLHKNAQVVSMGMVKKVRRFHISVSQCFFIN